MGNGFGVMVMVWMFFGFYFIVRFLVIVNIVDFVIVEGMVKVWFVMVEVERIESMILLCLFLI